MLSLREKCVLQVIFFKKCWIWPNFLWPYRYDYDFLLWPSRHWIYDLSASELMSASSDMITHDLSSTDLDLLTFTGVRCWQSWCGRTDSRWCRWSRWEPTFPWRYRRGYKTYCQSSTRNSPASCPLWSQGNENQPSPGVTGGRTGHTARAQPEIHRPPVHSGHKVIRTNLPLALPEGVQDILPELNQKFTSLLSTSFTVIKDHRSLVAM